MAINCVCGDPKCQMTLRTCIAFDSGSPSLWFTDKEGNQTLMYLDANTIVRLINELRRCLLHLAGQEAA